MFKAKLNGKIGCYSIMLKCIYIKVQDTSSGDYCILAHNLYWISSLLFFFFNFPFECYMSFILFNEEMTS